MVDDKGKKENFTHSNNFVIATGENFFLFFFVLR
jgi:hypothetical protein